ncbi:hypothetical protein [Vibrio gazogenes]|uniref:Uncharacterized protein n=1 Tax=Vibrio gazogenes TaxID=687 RepID=A0A1Z2SBK9_VIBGA|nr:hypothetical protein [Vibrio gazogenes]ASA54578.1 hypothetical protein BSQ33_01725 [Vibrio gazogenes]
MFLEQNRTDFSMKLVFQLSEELKRDPKRIEKTQSLTLNSSKPLMGLKGTYGLFASDEWWKNIRLGLMPQLYIKGIVQRVYESGQDTSGINNTVDLLSDDGSFHSVGIYVNDIRDTDLFCVGKEVEILYVLDELKKQPASDGSVNYSRIAIEMAVSIENDGR